jgi:ribonuclease HI
MTHTVLYIHGGARGEPGPAAAGVVLTTAAGEAIAEDCVFLGRMTQNAAEYHALIRGLQVAGTRGIKDIAIRTGSDRLAKQARGEHQLRNPSLSPLQQTATQLLRSFRNWRIECVAPSDVKRAEMLVEAELDRRGPPGPGSPAPPSAAGGRGTDSASGPVAVSPPSPAAASEPSPAPTAASVFAGGPSQAVVPPASAVFGPVRATVLQARPRTPGGRCELTEGAEIAFGRTSPPGVPLLVLSAVLPYVIALQRGAVFGGPGGEVIVSCGTEEAYYLLGLRREDGDR